MIFLDFLESGMQIEGRQNTVSTTTTTTGKQNHEEEEVESFWLATSTTSFAT